MTIMKIVQTINEAERFIKKAKEAWTWMEENDPMGVGVGSKVTAACRRASMDLTRALAELRKWGERG